MKLLFSNFLVEILRACSDWNHRSSNPYTERICMGLIVWGGTSLAVGPLNILNNHSENHEVLTPWGYRRLRQRKWLHFKFKLGRGLGKGEGGSRGKTKKARKKQLKSAQKPCRHRFGHLLRRCSQAQKTPESVGHLGRASERGNEQKKNGKKVNNWIKNIFEYKCWHCITNVF